jgi:hypothetical protein
MTMSRMLLVSISVTAVALFPSTAVAAPQAPAHHPTAARLVSGLQGGSGSTVGPDGALYVPETAAGRITRIDPRTGARRVFASGLPAAVIGLGGVTDVAFRGRTAYALVTLVGPDVGGSDVDGVYRIDGPATSTVVADIGAFAVAHPPRTPFDVPTGLQFAMEPFRDGFLVSDGHHNRVLRVRLNGRVSEQIAFGNIVPTGLARQGRTIYLAQAGPVPHLPEEGRIVSFRPAAKTARPVASGGRLLVDVEFGPHRALYGLSQGVWPLGGPAGSPATPNTGALLEADRHGRLRTVVTGLNQPTSLEFIGRTAYVVTLGGEVWKVR